MVSRKDIERQGKSGPDKAPEDGTYEWTNRAGVKHTVPNGIDPGWDYNVGKAAWGQARSQEAMDAWRATGEKVWQPISKDDWRSLGRPERIKADVPRAKPVSAVADVAEAEAALRKVLGGEEKIYSFEAKEGFRYEVLVNAQTLAGHVDLNRSPFFPYLPEALEDPQEVWLAFERNSASGQVVLRTKIIKMIETDRDRAIFIVAQARGGILESWTFIPTSDLKYINRNRVGKLIWARDGE